MNRERTAFERSDFLIQPKASAVDFPQLGSLDDWLTLK
jgi:hypothetical protein